MVATTRGGRGGTSVELVGGRELRRTLKAAGDDLSDLKDAHADAARIVAPIAAGRAPRRSGALAASVRGSGTKTASVVRAGGARVPYANPIHWGWPDRNIAPNEFVIDAAAESEPLWFPRFERAVGAILDRVRGA